jgi:predicted DNA-binding transcriptional regulator AlpA
MTEARVRALTDREVASMLGLKVSTLRAWRLRADGPPFVRFGRAVRYLESDVLHYMQTCRHGRRRTLLEERGYGR